MHSMVTSVHCNAKSVIDDTQKVLVVVVAVVVVVVVVFVVVTADAWNADISS